MVPPVMDEELRTVRGPLRAHRPLSSPFTGHRAKPQDWIGQGPEGNDAKVEEPEPRQLRADELRQEAPAASPIRNSTNRSALSDVSIGHLRYAGDHHGLDRLLDAAEGVSYGYELTTLESLGSTTGRYTGPVSRISSEEILGLKKTPSNGTLGNRWLRSGSSGSSDSLAATSRRCYAPSTASSRAPERHRQAAAS